MVRGDSMRKVGFRWNISQMVNDWLPVVHKRRRLVWKSRATFSPRQTSAVLINWFCCQSTGAGVQLCWILCCVDGLVSGILQICWHRYRWWDCKPLLLYSVLCLCGTAVKPRRTLYFCHTTFTSHGTTLNCRMPWKSDCPLLHRTAPYRATIPTPRGKQPVRAAIKVYTELH